MGPSLPVSAHIHASKYRAEGETFRDACTRIAHVMADDEQHFYVVRDVLLGMRFLPAGRVQASAGSTRRVTPYNCFVGRDIEDSMHGIMLAALECADTLRLGGGWGSDFSLLRPSGDIIKSLQSTASGPITFMQIFDATCGTVCSAGHRRGAMMGILRVDHPDILRFIRAKGVPQGVAPLWEHVEGMDDGPLKQELYGALQHTLKLTNFNLSIAVTDEFMHAVEKRLLFDLCFDGRVYNRVPAVDLWNEIMRSTWDWAEPGVIFIDSVNRNNNLYYCETISATNPCAEQPLPPFGVCLLGSFNLVKYLIDDGRDGFDFRALARDVAAIVPAMDNIIDGAIYPLNDQREQEESKRRMGLGVTGAANAIEAMGHPYGSEKFCAVLNSILESLAHAAYRASMRRAIDKGAFPAFDRDAYLDASFVKGLPDDIRDGIAEHGIRNSHLLSIAPTGTISMTADNISSGIEPVYLHEYDRILIEPDGPKTYRMQDYGLRRFGVRGRSALECSVADHLAVLEIASRHVDSGVSKTINVGPDVSFHDFKSVYFDVWRRGIKMCSTFRPGGKRFGIFANAPAHDSEVLGQACTIDPETGLKSCDS